jgi:hypothetical protein
VAFRLGTGILESFFYGVYCNKYRQTSQTGFKSKNKFVLPVVGSLRSESALNSLDFWDYSVELDCLQGPEGSHNPLILIIQ